MSKNNDEPFADKEYADQSEFIAERLHYHIKEYKEKRDSSKFMVHFTKLSAILLGGLLTLLLALKEYLGHDAASLIVIVTIILSVINNMLTSWSAFQNYAWKWVRYRTTLANLYTIRDEARFIKAQNEGLSDADARRLFDLLKAALKETNQEWASNRVTSIFGQSQGGDENKKEGKVE